MWNPDNRVREHFITWRQQSSWLMSSDSLSCSRERWGKVLSHLNRGMMIYFENGTKIKPSLWWCEQSKASSRCCFFAFLLKYEFHDMISFFSIFRWCILSAPTTYWFWHHIDFPWRGLFGFVCLRMMKCLSLRLVLYYTSIGRSTCRDCIEYSLHQSSDFYIL